MFANYLLHLHVVRGGVADIGVVDSNACRFVIAAKSVFDRHQQLHVAVDLDARVILSGHVEDAVAVEDEAGDDAAELPLGNCHLITGTWEDGRCRFRRRGGLIVSAADLDGGVAVEDGELAAERGERHGVVVVDLEGGAGAEAGEAHDVVAAVVHFDVAIRHMVVFRSQIVDGRDVPISVHFQLQVVIGTAAVDPQQNVSLFGAALFIAVVMITACAAVHSSRGVVVGMDVGDEAQCQLIILGARSLIAGKCKSDHSGSTLTTKLIGCALCFYQEKNTV